MGVAAQWTSLLATVMAKFPDQKITVKAWCDASFNFGVTVGPVLGALLYTSGGFFLPFALTGVINIGCGLVTVWVTKVGSFGENFVRRLPHPHCKL